MRAIPHCRGPLRLAIAVAVLPITTGCLAPDMYSSSCYRLPQAVSYHGSETCATVCTAHVMSCHSSETCVYITCHGEVHLWLDGLAAIGCVWILLPVQEGPCADQLNPI